MRQYIGIVSTISFVFLAGCVTVAQPSTPVRVARAPLPLADVQPLPVIRADLTSVLEELRRDDLNEAAIIQMLAFREQLMLPYRYSQRSRVDSRGIGPAGDLDTIRAGFQAVGDDGRRILERCVLEAASNITGIIHHENDDATVLGRACLDMMGEAYGDAALPFLIGFAADGSGGVQRPMLQRSALRTIRRAAGPVVAEYELARWRDEVTLWDTWMKDREVDAINESHPSPAAICDRTCQNRLMASWVSLASQHIAVDGHEPAEPRLVQLLRSYISIRHSRWLPWLTENSKQIMWGQDDRNTNEAGFVVDLWAQTAEETNPNFWSQLVMPALVLSIRSADVASQVEMMTMPDGTQVVRWHRARTRSHLAVTALERATGIHLNTPFCAGQANPDQATECLDAQAHFWRDQVTQPRWDI